MIYATIPNTNDEVKFTVLNYHHEKLGGREKSKEWQFANLSVKQDAKIHLLYLKKKKVHKWASLYCHQSTGEEGGVQETNDQNLTLRC